MHPAATVPDLAADTVEILRWFVRETFLDELTFDPRLGAEEQALLQEHAAHSGLHCDHKEVDGTRYLSIYKDTHLQPMVQPAVHPFAQRRRLRDRELRSAVAVKAKQRALSPRQVSPSKLPIYREETWTGTHSPYMCLKRFCAGVGPTCLPKHSWFSDPAEERYKVIVSLEYATETGSRIHASECFQWERTKSEALQNAALRMLAEFQVDVAALTSKDGG